MEEYSDISDEIVFHGQINLNFVNWTKNVSKFRFRHSFLLKLYPIYDGVLLY
jgi:hypothetical protein